MEEGWHDQGVHVTEWELEDDGFGVPKPGPRLSS